MKKTNRGSRWLAMLLAVTLVLGMLPVYALADGEISDGVIVPVNGYYGMEEPEATDDESKPEAKEYAVETAAYETNATGITAQSQFAGFAPAAFAIPTAADGEITVLLSYANLTAHDGLGLVRQPITLAPGLSEEYGYIDAFYGTAVTALDAIVAAHLEMGFTKDNISANLVVSADGWITRFMGVTSSNFVFLVNGIAPGAGADLIRLNANDVVELVLMKDLMGADAYTWFELGGERVDKITVGADVSFTLALNGIVAMGWGADGAGTPTAIEGASVVNMMMPTPPKGATFIGGGDVIEEITDHNGEVTIEFDAPGTYYLSAHGEMPYSLWFGFVTGDAPLMPPWLVIEVTDNSDPATGTSDIVNDPTAPFVPGAPTADAKTALTATLAYIAAKQNPVPSYGDEWDVLTLARGGYNVPEWYYESYFETVKEVLVAEDTNKPGNLATTNARLVLALTAIGVDARNVEGFNLVEPLTDAAFVTGGGLNAAASALLALDSRPYTSSGITAAKNSFIEFILENELADGGFNWGWGDDMDPDITGMVLQALAPYAALPAVAQTITDAIAKLSSIQVECGGYESWGSVNVEANAQVIVAATALGLDPVSDLRKLSGGDDANPVDSMLRFFVSGGGFQSSWVPGVVNPMSTQQAGYALVAYDRYLNGENSLYDMRDRDIVLEPVAGLILDILDGFISSAESKTRTDYSAASWNTMIARLNDAIMVQGNAGFGVATQREINTAASALNLALNALLPANAQNPAAPSFTASFRMTDSTTTWVNTTSHTFDESFVTIRDVIIRGLDAAGLAQEGAEDNFITRVRLPNGSWLANFDRGPNSGWTYAVNGVVPQVGIADFILQNGAAVTLHYTNDWTKEPNFPGAGGTGDNDTETDS
ncbi:MAG: DUF4430 domain-containing protein, partial [Defluviitaleaceae bacterium]|nr:DUF4430 domain-containing protein [Defluviitaleaceae bacterium]